jgi:hypothetical protein
LLLVQLLDCLCIGVERSLLLLLQALRAFLVRFIGPFLLAPI